MSAHVARLSLVDLTNLAVEAADTPMHQGGLGVLDGAQLLDSNGRVRIEGVRAYLESRLDRVPELRRMLWKTGPLEGAPVWVDDPSFRIENHVLVAHLPAPGGERRAIEFANETMAGLMDRSVAGNVTASFAALSYNGRLDLSVHVDADAWPDLDTLMRAMSAEWRALVPALAA